MQVAVFSGFFHDAEGGRNQILSTLVQPELAQWGLFLLGEWEITEQRIRAGDFLTGPWVLIPALVLTLTVMSGESQ